ncbi:MAG: ROK family protein, partial [Planctomycetes bacterium]|nr:ROK family protein [Planctomycetota bacterium]
YVGIDIGGTYTRLAVVDAVGRVQADRRCETPSEVGVGGSDLIEWLVEAYALCREETESGRGPPGSQPPKVPRSIGIALPGILDSTRSVVVRAVNVPSIEGLPIRERLSQRTGLPTMLECDTVAAAWGEYCLRRSATGSGPDPIGIGWAVPTSTGVVGSGRGTAPLAGIRRMAYLTIGTGVGGAVLLDGQVLRHTHHSAGHLGHLICDTGADAPQCACGVRGCLEARLGGPALNAAAVEAGFAEGLGQVELAYQEGQAEAIHFVNDAARYLSVGLINIAHIYPVDLLVVGGGVSVALPSLVRQASVLASAQESALIPEGMRVELAGLGEYSGVVGAALLAAEFADSQA